MKQDRWRSPIAWGAFAALLLFVLNNYGLLGHLGLTVDSFNQLISLIAAVLVAFGIFNDPTTKDKF